MKKVLNIIIIIFISIFIFNIDVKAVIVECKYKYNNNGKEQTKTMKIEYGDYNENWMKCSFEDGKKFYPSQRLVYNEDDKLFYLDIGQQYYKSSNGGITNSCPEKITVYSNVEINVSTDYSFAPESQKVVIFSSNGKDKDELTTLFPDASFDGNILNKIDGKQSIEYTYSDGETISEGIVEGQEIECEYSKRNDNEKYKFKFEAVGETGYFYKNGDWKKIYGTTSERIADCPKALNYDDSRSVYFFTEPNSCNEDDNCYFRSIDNEYYLNQKTFTYFRYDSKTASSIKIKISKDEGSNNKMVEVFLADDTNTKIDITNLDTYIEDFKSESNNSIPKYIIKKKDTSQYIFVNSLKDENKVNIKAEELYIESGAFGVSGTGLSDELVIETCKQLFGNDFLEFLNDYVFKVIWIGVPILLILLTSFDFAKVVFVDDKEGIQNAFTRLWKRAIAAVLVFLTPYIIILIANIINPTQTTVQSCARKIREMGSTSYIIK